MTERRLRAMQLAIAAAGFAGVMAELVLHEHWAEPWQCRSFCAAPDATRQLSEPTGNRARSP